MPYKTAREIERSLALSAFPVLGRANRVESEDGEPSRQRFELVGTTLVHHPGPFGEGHADGYLGRKRPQHRARVIGAQLHNPDLSGAASPRQRAAAGSPGIRGPVRARVS